MKAIVRRFYQELWNAWDLAVSDEILAPDVLFRGSLGVRTQGLEGFKRYVALVHTAFPDFDNAIDDLIAEGDKVVARLTYRGTHRGPLLGIPPTGRQVSYAGVAIFRIVDGKILECWVLGDTQDLLEQLGLAAPMRRAAN